MARGHEVVVDRHRVGAGDRLGGDDALRLGDVGEHQLGRAVADGVDVRHVGAAVLVDRDRAAVGEGHPGGLEAVALGARGEADGGEELVGLEHLLVAAGCRGDRDPHAGAGVLDALDLGAEQHLHAELLVVLGELLGDVGVLGGHHPVEELDDRDVDAEVLHDVGELDPDRARPGDDDRAREVLVEDLLLVGDDVLRDLTPGSIRVTAPAAMIRWSKVSCRVDPSLSATSIEVGTVSVPQPSISWTLFFFIRKCTPLHDAVGDLAGALVGGRRRTSWRRPRCRTWPCRAGAGARARRS